MGFLSKAWKGVKKVVKKAARGIKKVAKKIAYATPLGKKAWDFSSKVGKKVMKGVGKVMNALGPVGMIALTVLAPYAAPLWSAFGAAASAAGGFWGTVGSAIYNAGNWVAGTMGSMTQGITDAIGNVASGSFSKAADSAVKGFADAFTGKAGAAAVEKGTMEAVKNAAANAAAKTAAESLVTDEVAKQAVTAPINSGGFQGGGFMDQAPISSNSLLSKESAYTGAKASGVTYDAAANKIVGASAADVAVPGAEKSNGFLTKAVDVAKDALSAYSNISSQGSGAYQPITSVGGRDFNARGAQGEGGLGSQGGEFLTPDMKRRMAEAQARMSQGFGGQY